MKRKTIPISKIITDLNHVLKSYSEYQTNKEYLEGQRSLLESILHQTGNYQGYNYLWPNEVPEGERPGVNPEWLGHPNRFIIDESGKQIDQAFVNTDPNRIHYYS